MTAPNPWGGALALKWPGLAPVSEDEANADPECLICYLPFEEREDIWGCAYCRKVIHFRCARQRAGFSGNYRCNWS